MYQIMFVQLPVINIQYWRDETIWRWGNEESSADEVELVENVGKVDEEVRVLRNLNRRVGLIIQKSLNSLTFTIILRTKVLSSFIMEALFW